MNRFAICLFLSAMAAAPLQAAEIIGPARVVDGDTLVIGDSEIHLLGIDAPELKQSCRDADHAVFSCGEHAKDILSTLVGKHVVRCENTKLDRHKILAAVCYADTTNLNVEMIRQGWALAYRLFLEGHVPAQMDAHRAKRGLWAGTFDMPWEWRRK